MHRERRINRRQQGDLGEASAIEWLTRQGATVFIPFGHSPDVDLMAEIRGRVFRIQVKTSTFVDTTPNGHPRYHVLLATNGGNQSWSGVAKKFDRSRFDFLFVLTGEGRRWLIPATAIEATSSINVGGPKYSEFEIEQGPRILHLVYSKEAALESECEPGGVSKRSKDGGCKPSGTAFAGSTPASPINPAGPPIKRSKYERKLGQSCQAVINQKRRVTIPQAPLFAAGLQNGDRLRVRSEGFGRIVLERADLADWDWPG
jgi:hypothetical protein